MSEKFIGIKKTMERIEPLGAKRRPTINSYCMKGKIPSKRNGDRWHVEETFVEGAISWRKSVITTEELLLGVLEFKKLSQYDQKQCTRKVREQTADFLIEENKYSILFSGRLIDKKDEEAVREIIEEIIEQYTDRASMLPVAEAAERLGLSTFQLKKLIDDKKVKAKRVKNDWYVDEDEMKKFNEERGQYIGLYDLVRELLPRANTLFDIDDPVNRAMLNAWISSSELAPLLVSWENTGFKGDRRNSYYVPAVCKEKFEKLILPYLRQYGIAQERLEMLQSHTYWKKNPKTWKAIQDFSNKKLPHGMAALMETIVENIECEIMDANDEMIEKMSDYTQISLTEIYQQYFARFLKFVKDNYKCSSSMIVHYRTGKVHKRSINYTPYSVEEYFLFAYMNFDDDFIKSKEMVKKALEDQRYAFLWLRSCWHYVAMWRDIDILLQIPVVNLKITRKELKEKILSGEFGDKEADELSVSLESLIQVKKIRPCKTQREFLRVHFPESIRPVIGLAYACCLTHASGEFLDGIKPSANLYISFYGEDYKKVFGKKAFMNRRANKSYADAIVEITERRKDKEHKVRGYMVATFARGHVSKQGSLSGMTQKYLSCKMDGLTDNEILMLLWDLGTCSFTVNMLLEAVYGKSFGDLPVKQQAELVKESGISSYEAEMASNIVLKAYRRSKRLAEELIASYPTAEGQKKACRNAMVNLIEGNAAAKNNGISCLNLAFLRPCTEPHCKDCLGCENAILHKGALCSAFMILSDTYRKMNAAETEATRRMYQALIDEKYLPAIYELLTVCKKIYRVDVTKYITKIKDLIMNKGGTSICCS